MSSTDDLVPILKKLRLSGILNTLDLRSRQAVDENLSFPEFLVRLLCDEVERREAKQLRLRLVRAQFEHGKSLEDFDFGFNPKLPRTQIVDLATCTFIDRTENVLLLGPAGVGKSHVAQALGGRACRAGHRALFVSAHRMFIELRAARADGSYEKRLNKYIQPNLLVIDDLGLRPLQFDEPLDLYEIIKHRYERGSIIITSNRDIEEWHPLFGDALLASAAMDRLLHHAHVLRLEGGSYRNPPDGRGAQAADA